MHRTKILLTAALLIFTTFILASCNQAADPTTSLPTVTQTPEESTVPSFTPEESATPETGITSSPSTPSATPTPTPTPTPTSAPDPTPTEEKPTVTNTSGTFSSNTETNLNLICNWTVEEADEGGYKLRITVDLSSYSLFVSYRNNQKINIGENVILYSTPDIAIEVEAGKQLTRFADVTYDLTDEDIKNGIDASATWRFFGTYGGKQVDEITASTHISFN